MGWLFMHRSSMHPHATPKAYLDAQLTYDRAVDGGGTQGLRVIASALVGTRQYYAAVQQVENGQGAEIFAVMCLVRWNPRNKNGEHFGYKDMSENAGPCEANCPASILNLLSSTDHEYALDWRRRCLANLRLRSRKIEDGIRIRLPRAVTFQDGHVGSEFIVEKKGRSFVLRDPETRRGYRLTGLMSLPWSIVPVTKVYKTMFS